MMLFWMLDLHPHGGIVAKSSKTNRFQLAAIAAAICLSAPASHAAGLGKITVLSPLGQPLRAEIDLTASREELASITARVASPEAFKQVGIEYAAGVAAIRFALDKRHDGQYYLRMTTGRPVNEPFLDVLVELTWASGRMVREYTVLLDPPEALSRTAPVPVATPETARPAVVAPETARPTATLPIAPAEPATADLPAVKPAKARIQPAPADKAVAGANTRVVKSGDTLSKIAVATKPEGVGLEQMLVALLRSNQDAFSGGNMNRLRAGKILTIPDATSVADIAPTEAHEIVVAQARDFNAYRGKLAASVAAMPSAKEDAARQKDEGKIAPKLAEKPEALEAPKDKLEVSRTETTKDSKAIQGRISALEEDLVARDRALSEASGRVAELERNLTDLKKLAEMKSQAGAQLQQQAQVAKPSGTEKQPLPEAVSAKPVEDSKPAVQPAATVAADVPTKAAPPVDESADKIAKKPASVTPAAVAEAPSFVEENQALVYGGGGVLALLLGYLGLSAWRRKPQGGDGSPQPVSRLSEGDLTANSVFGSTGGQAVDTSASIQTDFSQASLAALDADEGVDPVAEADVYIAYGRDAQAEEILLDALKGDPTRLAIHLKLLEIYSARKNLPQFQKVAMELYGQTGGVGPDWDKAAAMGRILDPDNSLYGTGIGAAQEQSAFVVPSLSAVPGVRTSEDSVALDETVTLPGQLSQFAAAAEGVQESAPTVLDFDLDLGMPVTEPVTPAQATTALDFDLDLGGPIAGAVPAADSLDIDLSMPELPADDALSASKHAESATGGLDFEFDLEAPAATAAAIPSPTMPAIDFSGIDLDLATPAPRIEAAETAVVGDEDNPDVATKLELAQAYEEMGDREGARELLQEVLGEGSNRQQGIARDKLAALDA